MTTLYLHIGRGKTGTTAIQKFLAANRGILLENGLHYVAAAGGERGSGHQEFAKSFITELLDYMLPPKDPEVARKAIASEIMEATANSILISSENFEVADPKEVYKFFKELPVPLQIKIIFFVRSQDELAESQYNQLVKIKRESRSFTEYVEQDFRGADYLRIASAWEQFFGKENMICRVYDRAKHNSIAEFLACFPHLNKDLSKLAEDPRSRSSINSSLGYRALAAARFLNTTDIQDRTVYNKIFSRFQGDNLPALHLSSKEARLFRRRFAKSNKAFSKRYLEKECTDLGGRRFSDEERDKIREQIRAGQNSFFIFNTGCIRRGLDTIRIHRYLALNGWTTASRIREANLIIITTCGAAAEKEEGSLNAIRKAVRKKHKAARIIVVGCLPDINATDIRRLGVTELVSTQNYAKLDQLLEAKTPFCDIPECNTLAESTVHDYVLAYRLFRNSGKLIKVFNKFSMNKAFLKLSVWLSNLVSFAKSTTRRGPRQKLVPYFNISIANGCVGQCAYCAIRFATGALQSKPIDKILAEFQAGLEQGYQHIQLVSEDTGCYGRDIGTNILELLNKILAIPGDYKLILIDFNPRWLVLYWDDLLPLLVKHQEKIKELFVPMQSGSDQVLQAMNRFYTVEQVKPLLLEINKRAPLIQLRTTIMVGFPGESEEDFQASKDLIQDVAFYEVTLNKYEDRPDTASSGYTNKLPQNLIDSRTQALQAELHLQTNKAA